MMLNYRNVVIDTSALMAFFYKETGWEVVAEYMPQAVISTVNFCEAVKILLERKDISRETAEGYICKAVEKVLVFDQQQAGIAGELFLSAKQYGLSLGDRACIAAGISTGFPVITADRAWQELPLKDIEIILIR